MLPALMHATQVARPFHTKGWVYEEKVDGWRMLALKDKGRVRLVSRNEREALAKREISSSSNHGDLATPPLYMVFDLLRLGEKDYRPEPLKVRRKALEKLVEGQNLILPARRLLSNGMAAWAKVLHRGIEGYVAKDPESPYVGGRSLKWLKVKVPKYREEKRGFNKPE